MTSPAKTYKDEIYDHFEELLRSIKNIESIREKEMVIKAFEFANEAHSGTKRRSGEPFILHPITVAKIVATEIGLDSISIQSALLHDVVEDTSYTLEDIERYFGPNVARIVNGLTKIESVFGDSTTLQAENFRKILLTMIDDPRVILIKLADRLHNMRTLDSMPHNKQIKISSETIYLFAPLAHRLGLYSIKTELEDLSLKYRYPKVYEELRNKIESYENTRKYFIKNFITPIESKLEAENIKYSIHRYPKSIYSIWYSMQNEAIPFEEVYDLLKINIVFEPRKDIAEKTQCWNIYSLITDIYMPKPEMIRDFVTKPKANGYEALHSTFMGPDGKWVEVLIRTKRMHEIAERGLAVFLNTKNSNNQANLDLWINKVKEILDAPEENALEFLDDFKLNLFSSEILVFTPKGQMKTLPKDSTALDFAYEIHSEIGNHAIAAKVNHKLVSLNHKLTGGDQVEIVTSDQRRVNYGWLDFVMTTKARTIIKKALKSDFKDKVTHGKEIFEARFADWNLSPTSDIFKKIFLEFKLSSKDELYGKIGGEVIKMDDIEKIIKKKTKSKWVRYWGLQYSKSIQKTRKTLFSKDSTHEKTPVVLKENIEEQEQNYKTAVCCKPIPGDDVIGYYLSDKKIILHKSNCIHAIKLMSSHGDKIVPVKWKTQKILSYLVRISLSGIDTFTIYSDITTVISKELNVKIGSINLESHDGIFDGTIDLYVHDTKDLNNLILNISKIKGIENVKRVDYKEEEGQY